MIRENRVTRGRDRVIGAIRRRGIPRGRKVWKRSAALTPTGRQHRQKQSQDECADQGFGFRAHALLTCYVHGGISAQTGPADTAAWILNYVNTVWCDGSK